MGSGWSARGGALPILAVDGTLQKVHTPQSSEKAKAVRSGRKKMPALNHLCVCDWRGRWRAVFPGFDGARHDAQIFKATPLFVRREDFFEGVQTMLGDAGFEGCGILSVLKGKNLSAEEKGLVHDIRRHRVVIEFAFGYTKYKWQILRGEFRGDLGGAGLVFHLCCALTNLIFENQGYLRGGLYQMQCALEGWEQALLERFPFELWDSSAVSDFLQENLDIYKNFEEAYLG